MLLNLKQNETKQKSGPGKTHCYPVIVAIDTKLCHRSELCVGASNRSHLINLWFYSEILSLPCYCSTAAAWVLVHRRTTTLTRKRSLSDVQLLRKRDWKYIKNIQNFLVLSPSFSSFLDIVSLLAFHSFYIILGENTLFT